MIKLNHYSSLEEALQQYFNFNSFRTGQKEVVEKVLDGNNVLAIMPTGQGKSLCYQLPALLMPGVAVVISPLVALMKDQVDALHGKNLRQATFISSQLTLEEQRRRMDEMGRGKYKIVYVAPERLKSRTFLAQLARIKVSLLTIDEAHCISHWGHDFRPDYLYIREFHGQLPGNPKILALTATATPAVQQDILNQLAIPQAYRVISGSDRPNLCYTAGVFDNDRARLDKLQELLSGRRRSGLIYVATRKDAERIAAWLINGLNVAAAAYHAGLEPDERSRVQESFVQNRVDVVVGTNAFGMGIDKPDIRFVMHCCLPASLEAYYQEVGRAGRDGLPAECSLLFTHRDRQLQDWIIDNDSLGKEDIINFMHTYRNSLRDNVSVVSCAELEQSGLGETKVRFLISMLERLEIIHLTDRDGDNLYLEAGSEPPTARLMNMVLQEARQRTAERKEKLASMANWVHTSNCRRGALLNYFGESIRYRPETCCDNCLNNSRGKMMESDLPLVIFAAVKELPRPLGQKKLVDVLRGSRAKDIIEWGYEKISCYGKLSALSAAAVRGLVNQLIGDGFLSVAGDEYPVVVLTVKGEEILSSGQTIPIRQDYILPGGNASRNTAAENAGRDGELLAVLKEFRSELARRESMPPYVFFHDRVLQEIAGKKPVTFTELLMIKGLGEKKVARFGERLIDIVRSYIEGAPIGPDNGKTETPTAFNPDDHVPQENLPAEEKAAIADKIVDKMADKIESIFREGLSAEDIALRLGRAVSTVEGYLARLVAENRINVDELVPWPVRRQIYLAMEQVGIKKLAPVKKLLPEDIPYSAIRYVQAGLLKGEYLRPENAQD